MSLSCILLTAKGEVRRANVPTTEGTLSMDCVQKYLKRKETPQELYTAKYRAYNLYLIGFKSGRKGTETKASLPKGVNAFGDILVLMSAEEDHWNEAALPISPEQWKDFLETSISEEKDDEDDTEEEDQEEQEDQNEDEEEMSADDDDGDGDDDDEGTADAAEDVLEELEEEFVQEPEPVKKKKPVLPKGDAALRIEIDRNSGADSHPQRAHSLQHLIEIGEFSSDEMTDLEMAIFQAAFDLARQRFIPRNWKSPQFFEVYMFIYRKVISNLHPASPVKNPRLISRIKAGEFPLTSLPSMSAYDLFPENWKEMADKQLIREQKLLEGNKSRATDQYKCHRCGKSETTYYEMQTRSADEPTTIFITCLNCGKRWRQ